MIQEERHGEKGANIQGSLAFFPFPV